MTVGLDAPEFEQLIDPAAELTLLGTGYEFTEGPVWNGREQALYFSDIPGDARWKWTTSSGMQRVAWPTFKGNGMAYDVDGSLLGLDDGEGITGAELGTLGKHPLPEQCFGGVRRDRGHPQESGHGSLRPLLIECSGRHDAPERLGHEVRVRGAARGRERRELLEDVERLRHRDAAR